MTQTIRTTYSVSVLFSVFTGLLGCGGNGDVEPVSPSSSPPAVNVGAGFNQARGFNGRVRQIVAVPDGSGDVYVAGDFTTYSNRRARHMVRVRPDGTLHEGFTLAEPIQNPVTSVALADDASGDVYVADFAIEQSFSLPRAIGRVWRIHLDGTIEPAFAVGMVTVISGFFPSGEFRPVVRSLVPVGDGSGRVYVAVSGPYNGTPVGPVVRLNSDGSLDSTFSASFRGGAVFRIVPADDGSGDLYIATFRQDDPNTWLSYLLLRLNADGTQDPDFDTGVRDLFQSRISFMIPVGDGTGDLFAVGVFPNFADPSPIVNAFRGLVRINPNGTMDVTSPRPQVDPRDSVFTMAKASDGSGDWFVGQLGAGQFRVVRYRTDGTLHSGFTPVQILGSAGIAPSPDHSGDVYVAGDFVAANGAGVNHLARINPDGTLDAGTVRGSGLNNIVFPNMVAAARDGSGDVYAVGAFTSYNGAISNGVIRLDADGRRDTGFITGRGIASSFNLTPVPTRDGTARLYVGGRFATYDGVPVPPLIRLLPNGMLDRSFVVDFPLESPGFASSATGIETIASAEDNSGDLYVGGPFDSYQGVAVPGLLRLHSDGSVDRTFTAGLPAGSIVVKAVPAADGSGDVYVRFRPAGPFFVFETVRLKGDGTLDNGFSVPASYRSQLHTDTVASLRDGDLLVVSSTVTSDATYTRLLARLNSDGTVDAGFAQATFNGDVHDVEVDESGNGDFYVGGGFTSMNGSPAPGIVRLTRNGMIDPSFIVDSGFDGYVSSIEQAKDGSGDIFVGGYFTKYQSTTMQGIARLNRDGTAD